MVKKMTLITDASLEQLRRGGGRQIGMELNLKQKTYDTTR
jgi:hypothetical protein